MISYKSYQVDITYKKKKKVTEQKPKQQSQQKKPSSHGFKTQYQYIPADEFKLNVPDLVAFIVLVLSVTMVYKGASLFLRRADQEAQQIRNQRQREEERREQERREEQERNEREEWWRQQYQQPPPPAAAADDDDDLTEDKAKRLLGFKTSENPTQKQVEKAYRQKSREFHPGEPQLFRFFGTQCCYWEFVLRFKLSLISDMFPKELERQKGKEFRRLTSAKELLIG